MANDLVAEAIRRASVMDARGMNPYVQQRMEQQMLERIEAYRQEGEAWQSLEKKQAEANERHRQNARRIDEKLANNPVDEDGNPLPWSQG